MKLFECFGTSGFHTCIATTFDLSFDAYEAMALSRLREAKCGNNMVIADPRMVALALERSSGLPKFAGRHYSVVEAQISGSGVFHPKLILQLGKDSGRLIVGSANLTAPGLAGNLEVVGEVHVKDDDQAGVPLLRAAMAYIARTMSPDAQIARQQIEWAVSRTPWLRDGIDSAAPIELEDGGQVAFLAKDDGPGIAERFRELVSAERVRRLLVISPYWDMNLSALKWLHRKLSPASTKIVLQPRTQLFPVHALGKRDAFALQSLDHLPRAQSRFAHAKVIIAQTAKSDHILYGSANCTEAALGSESFTGSNEEVSLYRRLAPGDAVKLLDLGPALADDASLLLSDLPRFAAADELPLGEVQGRLPGRFEVKADTLIWWPATAFDADEAKIDLLDQNLAALHVGLAPTRLAKERRIAISGSGTPAFARVSVGDTVSALAVVTVAEAIYESQRKVKSTKIRDALEHFEDEDVVEGLWLLEVIDQIHRAETEHAPPDQPPKVGRRNPNTDTVVESKTLSYEDFIKGRSSASTNLSGESSTAASYNDAVRRALNFLIGRGKKTGLEEDEVGQVAKKLLDMGDETADGEEAIESGDFAPPLPASEERKLELARKRALKRRRKYYEHTAAKIAAAVEILWRSARWGAEQGSLSSVYLLRLRALLMVILTAGTDRSHVLPPALNQPMSRVQVLALQGEKGWPRLVMQLLYQFFMRPPAAALKATFPRSSDQSLPVDVAECWACCLWAACAIQVAIDNRGVPFVAQKLPTLAHHVYQTIGLRREELTSGLIASVMEALSARLAHRLGVDAQKLWELHLRTAAAL